MHHRLGGGKDGCGATRGGLTAAACQRQADAGLQRAWLVRPAACSLQLDNGGRKFRDGQRAAFLASQAPARCPLHSGRRDHGYAIGPAIGQRPKPQRSRFPARGVEIAQPAQPEATRLASRCRCRQGERRIFEDEPGFDLDGQPGISGSRFFGADKAASAPKRCGKQQRATDSQREQPVANHLPAPTPKRLHNHRSALFLWCLRDEQGLFSRLFTPYRKKSGQGCEFHV